MFDFLDKLRQKPKPVRQRIALITTVALSFLIFFMWWTTFTISGSDKVITVGEALSPVGAMAEMASVAGSSFKGFSENLKSHVLQVQYEASSSDPAQQALKNESTRLGETGDVVYPEDVYEIHIPDKGGEVNAASNE
jgi:hypothetical protein